jgi:hypothetical protein
VIENSPSQCHQCMKILNGYDSGFLYETKTFKDHVYKNHQQVVDKLKWWAYHLLYMSAEMA